MAISLPPRLDSSARLTLRVTLSISQQATSLTSVSSRIRLTARHFLARESELRLGPLLWTKRITLWRALLPIHQWICASKRPCTTQQQTQSLRRVTVHCGSTGNVDRSTITTMAPSAAGAKNSSWQTTKLTSSGASGSGNLR